MNDYSFLSDLLHTFQSLNDWIKLVVLLIPPCFVLCVFGLFLRHRARIRAIEAGYAERERIPVNDGFDRVEYLQAASISFDEEQETLPAPFATVRRRN